MRLKVSWSKYSSSLIFMASAPKHKFWCRAAWGQNDQLQGRQAQPAPGTKPGQEHAFRKRTLNVYSQHTTRGCERLISIPTLVRLLPKACAESNKSAPFGNRSCCLVVST